MVVTILDRWKNQGNRIAWSRWEGIQEYYLEKIRFDRSKLPELAPKHPAFEPGYRFNDWVHFVPNDTVSRIRSAEEFESEYTDIISEVFDNIEKGIEGEVIPLEAQWNDSYTQESTYEERRRAIEAFLCRVLTLQMRGDVNFEKIEDGDVEIPSDPSVDAPTKRTYISVERYQDLNQVNVVRFSISNPLKFFKKRFGDSTLMYEKLLNSNKEPESVESDLELDKVKPSNWRIHTGISYSE